MKHALGSKLCSAQKKLEASLHLLIHSLETGSPTRVHEGAALVRSCWQDILQLRRKLIAGKQRSKLSARPDEASERLHSREEEEKMQREKCRQTRKQPPRYLPSQPFQWGRKGDKGKGGKDKKISLKVPRLTTAQW